MYTNFYVESSLLIQIFKFFLFPFRSRSCAPILLALVPLSLTFLFYARHSGAYREPASILSYSQEESPEIRQVVFVKIHKAASSTMQNILLRFAMARNLKVLLPKKGHIIGQTRSAILRKKMMPLPEGSEKFDILCNHVVYNATVIARYFPDSAIRVAIIREPMKQVLSALTYYGVNYPTYQLKNGIRRHPHDAINGFLRHPEDFYQPHKLWGALLSYINNRMSLDLGFDSWKLQASKLNDTKIDAFIKQTDDEFDFVLLSDYFDESLVLLRRHLHWSIKDIIYIKRNEMKQLPKSSPFSREPNLTAEVINTFRKWDRVDYKLYEHFLKVFLEKINSEPKFVEEVQAFKRIQIDVEEFCLRNDTGRVLLVEKNAWTHSFAVTRDTCILMLAPEKRIVSIARNQQRIHYRNIRKSSSKNMPPKKTHGP